MRGKWFVHPITDQSENHDFSTNTNVIVVGQVINTLTLFQVVWQTFYKPIESVQLAHEQELKSIQ